MTPPKCQAPQTPHKMALYIFCESKMLTCGETPLYDHVATSPGSRSHDETSCSQMLELLSSVFNIPTDEMTTDNVRNVAC